MRELPVVPVGRKQTTAGGEFRPFLRPSFSNKGHVLQASGASAQQQAVLVFSQVKLVITGRTICVRCHRAASARGRVRSVPLVSLAAATRADAGD
ncbi:MULTISPECIES: hypothetical protein [unclassified Bradyrhizobium]|uniref:hypothetical protein n=1 Tax=unclassified Bradyrhizobium TaxID=2631580 RepID=UPI0024E0FE55|nr:MULTISPECIES: hypothetical protein [unclassified Bradyrhizobium]